ncbi:MAG: abortive phage resistance protein, partial [Synechococcales cyanobacterium RM1_1_8]|nr:abortive phage resistance protein [Synechococcales cyanobacterium RM1_1_8]
MDINASIIDQRLEKVVGAIATRAAEQLGIADPVQLKSLAFVYLCVETILDLEEAPTFDCLTEGGGDFGVDAIHISEEHDGEFTISLFQGKYKQKLDGSSAFPENGIKALIDAINYLFDPAAKVESINPRL